MTLLDGDLAARLHDLPHELTDDDAERLADELARAGLTLASAAVRAGQRSRAAILHDAAAELLGVHRRPA